MRMPWSRRPHAEPAPAAARPVARAVTPSEPPPSPAGWAFLPPLQRTIGAAPSTTAPLAFPMTLPAWRNPSFLGAMAHAVSDSAPSGVIDGDGSGVATGAPSTRAPSVDLALRTPPPSPRMPVQRSIAPAASASAVTAPAPAAEPVPPTEYTSAPLPDLPVRSVVAGPDDPSVPDLFAPAASEPTASAAVPGAAVPAPATRSERSVAAPAVQRMPDLTVATPASSARADDSLAPAATGSEPLESVPLTPATAPVFDNGGATEVEVPRPGSPAASPAPVQRIAEPGAPATPRLSLPRSTSGEAVPPAPAPPAVDAAQPGDLPAAVQRTVDGAPAPTRAAAPAASGAEPEHSPTAPTLGAAPPGTAAPTPDGPAVTVAPPATPARPRLGLGAPLPPGVSTVQRATQPQPAAPTTPPHSPAGSGAPVQRLEVSPPTPPGLPLASTPPAAASPEALPAPPSEEKGDPLPDAAILAESAVPTDDSAAPTGADVVTLDAPDVAPLALPVQRRSTHDIEARDIEARDIEAPDIEAHDIEAHDSDVEPAAAASEVPALDVAAPLLGTQQLAAAGAADPLGSPAAATGGPALPVAVSRSMHEPSTPDVPISRSQAAVVPGLSLATPPRAATAAPATPVIQRSTELLGAHPIRPLFTPRLEAAAAPATARRARSSLTSLPVVRPSFVDPALDLPVQRQAHDHVSSSRVVDSTPGTGAGDSQGSWSSPADTDVAEVEAPRAPATPPLALQRFGIGDLGNAMPAHPSLSQLGGSAMDAAHQQVSQHASGLTSQLPGGTGDAAQHLVDDPSMANLESAGESAVGAAEHAAGSAVSGAVSHARSAAGAAAGALAGHSPQELDALAKQLVEPLSRRIKAEMLLDRERRGLRSDAR